MEKATSPWSFALLIVLALAARVGVILPAIDSFGDDDSYGRLAVESVKHKYYGFPVDLNNPAEVGWKAGHPDREKKDAAPADADASSTSAADQDGGTTQSPLMRPTAFRPPMYPALLTLAVVDGKINGPIVAVIHVILGLATVMMVYFVAQRLSLRSAWIPALAVALDPILLRGSQLLMTETLITLLAVSAWWLYLILVRPSLSIGRSVMGVSLGMIVALLLGLVLGMSVLTRPTMLPWALLTIATLSLRSSEAGNRVSIITAALLMVAALNVGWLVRNKQQLGEPIWTTTHGGYTLLLANNPSLYQHFAKMGPDRNWDDREFQTNWDKLRHGEITKQAFLGIDEPKDAKARPKLVTDEVELPELVDDRLATEVARELIRSKPNDFVRSCLYRAGWLWAVYPNQPDTRLGQLTHSNDPVTDSSKVSTESSVVVATGSTEKTETLTPGQSSKDSEPKQSASDQSVARPSQENVDWQTSVKNYFVNVVQHPAMAVQLAIGIWYSLWFFMALVGGVYLWDAWTSRVWLMPLLLVLSITAIHAVYWSNMRMRAPLMPIVYVVACWPLMRVRTPARTLG